MQFILWDKGSENGPHSLASVLDSIQRGKVSPKILARRDTGGNWQPLDTLLPKEVMSTLGPKEQKPAKTAPAPVQTPAASSKTQEQTQQAKRPINRAARRLSVGLIVVSFIFLGIGFLKSSPQKGSLEELYFRQAEEQEERTEKIGALGRLATASGYRATAREINDEYERGQDRVSDYQEKGQDLRDSRERTMYLCFGLGAFLLVAGAAIRVYS